MRDQIMAALLFGARFKHSLFCAAILHSQSDIKGVSL